VTANDLDQIFNSNTALEIAAHARLLTVGINFVVIFAVFLYTALTY